VGERGEGEERGVSLVEGGRVDVVDEDDDDWMDVTTSEDSVGYAAA
jgi:hypothetical protein